MSIDLQKDMSSVVKGSLGFVGEFKAFISRGNVVDLAVGVIIGGAFGQITTSLVNDVVMPPISFLLSGVNVKDWKYVIPTHHMVTGADGKQTVADVSIAYGNFLQTCLNFLIVAFVIFVVIKAINTLKRKEEAAPSAPPTPSPQEVLLTEIRDLLAKERA